MNGTSLSECFAIIDIETTRVGEMRERKWRGRFTSLSNPQHVFAGPYLLRPRGEEQHARIEVTEGGADRMGVTSDCFHQPPGRRLTRNSLHVNVRRDE